MLRNTTVCALLWLSPYIARAGAVLEFNAGVSPQNVQAPSLGQWYAPWVDALGNSVAGIQSDGGGGENAWQVSANLQSEFNPAYIYAPYDNTLVQIAAEGARLSATARFVSEMGGQGGVGLGAYLNNRGYLLGFDLSASGALQATVLGENGAQLGPYVLTPPGIGTADYHDFEIRFPAGRDPKAEVWFDGAPVLTNWTGFGLNHFNTFQWGANALGRGVMNFHTVRLETGPFGPELPGDFNGDQIVDAADYSMWRDQLGASVTPFAGADANDNGRVDGDDYNWWKQNFGESAGSLVASAAPVPEPSGWLLLVGGVVLAVIGWRTGIL